MDRFTLTINTGNAVFDDMPGDDVARILRHVANQVEAGLTESPVRDVNGNTVGTFGWAE